MLPQVSHHSLPRASADLLEDVVGVLGLFPVRPIILLRQKGHDPLESSLLLEVGGVELPQDIPGIGLGCQEDEACVIPVRNLVCHLHGSDLTHPLLEVPGVLAGSSVKLRQLDVR